MMFQSKKFVAGLLSAFLAGTAPGLAVARVSAGALGARPTGTGKAAVRVVAIPSAAALSRGSGASLGKPGRTLRVVLPAARVTPGALPASVAAGVSAAAAQGAPSVSAETPLGVLARVRSQTRAARGDGEREAVFHRLYSNGRGGSEDSEGVRAGLPAGAKSAPSLSPAVFGASRSRPSPPSPNRASVSRLSRRGGIWHAVYVGLSVALAAVLVSCGSGGGHSGDRGEPVERRPNWTEVYEGSNHPLAAVPSDPVLAEVQEGSFLQEINDYRAFLGLPPLILDEAVADVARGMSEHMASDVHDFVAPVDPEFNDPEERAFYGAGITAYRYLELIVKGPGAATAQEALAALLENEESRAVIEDPYLESIGIGYHFDPGPETGDPEHPRGDTWTVDLMEAP